MSHCRTFAVELVETRKKSIWGYYSDHMKVLKCILCVLNLAKPYFMCTFFSPVNMSISILYAGFLTNLYAIVK